MKLSYTAIGVIRSDYKKKERVPIQGALARNSKGIVELFPEFKDGLKDLDGFSHIILIYHFHLSKGFTLVARPFLEDKLHGVFAMRAPKRPNPIGISVVKLDRIKGNMLFISECDIIDGTPLLDIKPYVSSFDSRESTIDGWTARGIKNIHMHIADDRFS